MSIQIRTDVDKSWEYEEYYRGDEDLEKRKTGQGELYFTGAKSLENYVGRWVRDTMHGLGEYRIRYLGQAAYNVTYEGHFYNNCKHGYGVMSYSDGCVFNGLFFNNFRWGPGVETEVKRRELVGLWRGSQLIRLAWQPPVPDVVPDIATAGVAGRLCVDSHRIRLKATVKRIGEVNSALDLLKQYGAHPKLANERWQKLYPKYCTDLGSPLCHVEVFEHDYYRGRICDLQEIDNSDQILNLDELTIDQEDRDDNKVYYAWNNNRVMLHIMKHSFRHDSQRSAVESGIDLTSILSGARSNFKPPGKQEMDSRSLLMVSYLGKVANVIEYVNSSYVYPDVADAQGNTPIMYAAVGDHPEIIHFLVQAGADVNSFNDSCCTALGVALMRFTCIQRDIAPADIVKAVLPIPDKTLELQSDIFEWNISREMVTFNDGLSPLKREISKISKNTNIKRTKSANQIQRKSSTPNKTTPDDTPTDTTLPPDSDSEIMEDQVYNNLCHEYETEANNVFIKSPVQVPYIFEVDVVDLEKEDTAPKKNLLPNKNNSKLKNIVNPSKEPLWCSDKSDPLAEPVDQEKLDKLNRIRTTITQLLFDGAKPQLVKCPQPALMIALQSGEPDLVSELIRHGADINEIYPQFSGYTPLHIMISRPFTPDSLPLIKVMLENGADAVSRMRYVPSNRNSISDQTEPGPTLLHVVMAKKLESNMEQQIYEDVIDLLLDYNCNPLEQFRGESAIDVAVNKGADTLNIFIKNAKTDLNAPINMDQQSLLFKLFLWPCFKKFSNADRTEILTNLLLYGANPLLPCQDGEVKYKNLFVYTSNILNEIKSRLAHAKPREPSSMNAAKGKKIEKDNHVKSQTKVAAVSETSLDMRQAIDLVTECARLLHIRWIQSSIAREILDTIIKFKHRHWNMILKDINNTTKKSCSLWLNTQRCYEIWNILKISKKYCNEDNKTMKYLLYVVFYYQTVTPMYTKLFPSMSAREKCLVEADVGNLLKEYKATKCESEFPCKRPYVKPELDFNGIKRFNVCFECSLPLENLKVTCKYCKIVSFCDTNCLKGSMVRSGQHPCSRHLSAQSASSSENLVSTLK